MIKVEKIIKATNIDKNLIPYKIKDNKFFKTYGILYFLGEYEIEINIKELNKNNFELTIEKRFKNVPKEYSHLMFVNTTVEYKRFSYIASFDKAIKVLKDNL